MTQHADTATPRPPLVCEVICGDVLERHMGEFRVWMALLWDLTVEALRSSGTIEQPDDVYHKALWEGVVGAGEKDRTRRLSARALSETLGGNDLWGFGVTARPLPHVPEPTGTDSTVHLDSIWHSADTPLPNAVSWLLPARYTVGLDDAWVSRLVQGFVAFGRATCVRSGLIGWTQRMMEFTGYRQWEIDFRSLLWLPGWAMLLSEGHMTKVGGASALDGTGLFRPVEQVGDGTYLVRSRADLLDFDTTRLQEVESVLRPILLPPPFDPAAALDRP